MPNNIDKIRKALLDATKKRADFDPRDSEIMNTVGRDLVNTLSPVLAKIMEETRVSKESLVSDLKGALSELKIDIPPAEITATIPDIILPDIRVPDVKVPEIKIPPIKIPDIVMPDEMNVRGWVQLQGVDLNNPLPVQLRDAKGNPVNMFENLTSLISQGGGGGHKIVKISDINASAFSFINPDGRVQVELPAGATGLTDIELRASSVPVEQVSGSLWSVVVKEIFNSTATDLINADNRLKVSIETGGGGLTDAELRALSVPVEQVSGSIWSVYATGFGATVGATIIDSSGVGYSGDNPLPISGTVAVSGVNNTVGANVVDSSGVAYSSSNPLPIDDAGGSITIDGTVSVSGSITSTVAVGEIPSDTADTGSAPLKIGGIARTANPSAVAAGDMVTATYDDVGRQLTRPVQVRDLIATAYAALVSGSGYGSETTLLAGVAGEYHDLIYIMGSNTSSVAVKADIRASTAGTVIMSLEIPASGTAGVALPVPQPAPFADQTWTVDLPDETGGNVYISAQFSKEV
jgi:hypothetical protein